MGIEIDYKFGGAGSTFFASIVAIEELAKVDASVSVVCDVQNTLVNEYFRRYASVELQEKYFPKLAKDLVRRSKHAYTHRARKHFMLTHLSQHKSVTHCDV